MSDRLAVEYRGAKLEPVLRNSWLSGSDLVYVHQGDKVDVLVSGRFTVGTVIGLEVEPACNGDRLFPVFLVKHNEDGITRRYDQHTSLRIFGSGDRAPASAVSDGWVKTWLGSQNSAVKA